MIPRSKRLDALAAELRRIAGGSARFRKAALSPSTARPALLLALADAIERARLAFEPDEAEAFPWRFPGGPERLAAFFATVEALRRQGPRPAAGPAPKQGELFSGGRE